MAEGGGQGGAIKELHLSDYADIFAYMKSAARIFKALADETRLRILLLLTRGELCVCDLMAVLELPQSTVSRHLATLRHAGWVEDRRQGVWMYYKLAQDGEPLQRALGEVLVAGLAELPLAAEDAAALQSYLATKRPGGCG